MCLKVCGVILGVVMCRPRSWTLIILVVPFQIRILYDSMKQYSQVEFIGFFFVVDSVYNFSMAITVVFMLSVP